jgi:hypothetical protein
VYQNPLPLGATTSIADLAVITPDAVENMAYVDAAYRAAGMAPR